MFADLKLFTWQGSYKLLNCDLNKKQELIVNFERNTPWWPFNTINMTVQAFKKIKG